MDTTANTTEEKQDVAFIVYYYGLYAVMFIINITGNVIVIHNILRHARLRKPKNYFLVSLAVSDITVGIIYPIYSLGHLLGSSIQEALGQWPACMVILPALVLVMTSSSFHLVAITVTRYIAIVHHNKHQSLLTSRRSLLGIAITWILATVLSLPLYIIKRPDTYMGICRYEIVYEAMNTWIFFTIQFLLPLVIMLVLYVQILIKAKIKAKAIRGRQHKNSKSFVMVTMLLGWFSASYMPLSIYLIATVGSDDVNKYGRATIRLITYTNYLINVFIYAGRLKAFRECFCADVRLVCNCIGIQTRTITSRESEESSNDCNLK